MSRQRVVESLALIASLETTARQRGTNLFLACDDAGVVRVLDRPHPDVIATVTPWQGLRLPQRVNVTA